MAGLIIVTLISCIATYAAFTETPPFGNSPNLIFWLLNLDLILLIWLIVIIARKAISIWSGRKKKLAGSKLYARLALIFSVIAALPAILMAIFSMFFFHFGVQAWFSDTIKSAVLNSDAVAESYLEEYQQNIKADILAMANDIDNQAAKLLDPQKVYNQSLDTQALFRNLQEAIILRGDGQVIARSGLTFTLTFEAIPNYLIEQAKDGEVIVLTNDADDKVRALVRLNTGADNYLFVGRSIDPVVLSNVKKTKDATSRFESLENNYSKIQILLTLIFAIVALLLLLIAILIALIIARQLVRPISAMISASDRVRAGDLTARVTNKYDIDEFNYLVQSFNKMTEQIDKQQKDLVSANRQLDSRRRRIETVLSNITAGVIAVNKEAKITLINDAATIILKEEKSNMIGDSALNILPELKEELDQIFTNQVTVAEKQITHTTPSDNNLILLTKVTAETFEDNQQGALITFSDITDLQKAQKKAAWSDVAQRIAHEIKNPLTPIQLSAERIKRKYKNQIDEKESETFDLCIDTILRRVEDIGRMVGEFSDFARMPQATMIKTSISSTLREQIQSHQTAYPHVKITLEPTTNKSVSLETLHDPHQMAQVFTNILQNAIDSIEASNNSKKGKIVIICEHNDNRINIVITDNGNGIPDNIDAKTLTTPYVTKKEKGTGLGLAIVEKIISDHDGKFTIENNADNNGAAALIDLPIK